MSTPAWIPLGLDIPGEAAGDQSGHSVAFSSDGSRVAIGAAYNDDGGSQSGHVRVWDWTGSVWIRAGLDIPGEATGDQSGNSVAVSSDGNRIAIGTPYNDDGGSQSGHVRVWDWVESEWIRAGLDIDGDTAHDQSGLSIALSSDGNIIAIGARYNDGGGDNSGRVQVFNWNGSAWTPVGLDIPGDAAGDQSGFSVAMSSDGSRVAIGARYNKGGGNNSGHVRVFDWNGTEWVLVGIAIPGESANDESGYSVALSSDGSRVAIGAIYNADSGSQSGHGRVFDWNGSVWEPVGNSINGKSSGDQLGKSIAMSSDGSRVVIGAVYNNDGGINSGYVKVLEWSGVPKDPDTSSVPNTQNQDQSSSAIDAGAGDEEYFASSVEEIKLGRESVTGLAAEPPHVFDIVWNMDLNTALASIDAPYVIDGEEAEHKDGTTAGTKMYTLGTSSNTIEIEAVQTFTAAEVTELTYTHTDASTRVGNGATEAACMSNLAKQLQTDGATVSLLAADGSQDVGSTLAVLMSAAVSSSTGNSLEAGNQTAAVTDFMTQLKSSAGTYEWYSSLANNDKSVTTQTRNGLAQLFDRTPELNNLIGSAATSSSFLDSDIIKSKLQDNTHEFYTKFFSELQLREVLESVADRGSRITGTGASRTFNFTAGDSITAVVKVTDTDSADQNTDRWLVTLQQTA
jgi:hypothetical protein